MSKDPQESTTAEDQDNLAVSTNAPRRTRRAYRHSRPVFDRPIRIHSEYARRLVSQRQFRPTMTALYGIDVILRIVASDSEADQFESAIAQRLEELSTAIVAERERLQLALERHDLMQVRPRYTHPVELRVQIASPHIAAYTNLILELDQVMMAIDTLWLSGLLASKERTAMALSWRNRLGRAAQGFIELHRYAYAEAERRGQREAVDRADRNLVTLVGDTGEAVEGEPEDGEDEEDDTAMQ